MFWKILRWGGTVLILVLAALAFIVSSDKPATPNQPNNQMQQPAAPAAPAQPGETRSKFNL